MLLERDRELATLTGLLDDLDASGGRVALVRGEAGIGKTALITRFVEDVGRSATVLVGACDDLLTPQPLGPIWDVARRDASISAPLSEGDLRGVMEALLSVLSGELRPTVLIVEDTQWADEATLDVIRFLGRRIARANGVLVLTYRDGELDDDHPLRQVIGELPPSNLVRLSLAPLSSAAIRSMVGELPLVADEVLFLTGGNPLFVSEVLASGTGAVPTSVRESVLARVSKLSPEARRLVQSIAVVPGGAERALVDGPFAASPELLNEAVRQELLSVGPEVVTFRHELQRRAVESSLAAEDRRQLNQRVLDALAGDSDPSRFVHHAVEAGDVDAIVTYAPRAARAATVIESYREATAHFRALEPYLARFAAPDRADVLEDWARAASYLGDPGAVRLVTDAIAIRRALGDELALARTLTFAATPYERNAAIEQAEACAAEAVSILEAHPPSAALAAAITQMAWLAFMRGTDDRRAARLADGAIEIAEEVGAELAAVRAMTWKGAIAFNQGAHGGQALVEEAHRRAARAGFRYEETMALVNLAGMSGDTREIPRAADLVQRARDTAARYEIRLLESITQSMHAEILLWQGHWELAEDTATAALDGPPAGATVGWRLLGLLQARRGRAEALTTLEHTWSMAERSGELQQMDPAASVLAEYLWLTGDRDPDRLAIVSTTFERSRASGRPWPSGAFVFWMWELGLLDDVPGHTPHYFRAIIDGQPEVAAGFWRSKGAPYEEGLALMHGDEPARLRAIEIFEGLGATATADRVRQELRATGVRVPRGRSASTREHAAGLTARQAEVLDLLAEGLSNAEIADRLFVSHRTVENHVAAVLMKLDVSDRHAAVAMARDRGLLGDT